VLLAAEAALRGCLPRQRLRWHPGVWQPDPTGLGHRLAPGLDVRVHTGEREVRLLTDAQGHRTGPSAPVEPRLRVLALGDSFLEALAVGYEDTLGARLEAALSGELGVPVAVVNAGVSGADPNRYRLAARAELARAPHQQVLVLLFLGNDVVERRVEWIPARESQLGRGLRWPASAAPRALVQAWVYPAWTWLRLHSELAVLVKDRALPLLVRLGLADRMFPEVFLRREAGSPRWAVTAELCAEIAHEAAAHGARAHVVLLPADYQVDAPLGHAYARGSGLDPAEVDLEQPSRQLGRELSARGVAWTDLLPALRRAHAEGVALYGRVDRHLSPAGHDRVARELAPLVAADLRAAARVPR
jgi:lysophospholipase L1-like esterase